MRKYLTKTKQNTNRLAGIVSGCLLLLSSSFSMAQTATVPSPNRVILFIIDGLAVGTLERFKMPALQQLAKEGVHYQEMHLPLPGHPEKSEEYPWTCSMPNPMLMSGSPFIGVKGIRESLIQHQFDGKDTAFVVNARSYEDVSGGFATYISEPHKPDSLVIEKTKEVLLKEKPVFMRVHLQRPGIQGEKVSKEAYADKPYYRNIWHEASLYREACEQADQQLGIFVAWLKEQNLWEGTVLLICGDHGQADEGWHEPYSGSANRTPLIIAGSGVAAARTFDYCEVFDIAPTIAALARRTTPPHAIGRVLSEAFDPKQSPAEYPRLVEQLNEVLIAAHKLSDEKKEVLHKAGFLPLNDICKWHTTEAGADFKAFVTRQKDLFQSNR